MKNFFVNSNNKYMTVCTLLTGTFFMAFAIVCFFDVVNVVVGGVSGIAIIIKAVWDIPMWVISAVFNIPIFIVAYKRLERGIFYRTLFATAALTVFLGIIPPVKVITGNLLADMIAGAACMGAGLGLVFRCHASSGGTDLLATLINQRVRHISIPKVLACVDAIIVILGATTFGVEKGIYSFIGIFVVTKVSDYIIEGPDRAKLMYVISKREEEIIRYIVDELKRGATCIDVYGAYTKEKKRMIMCVISTKEIVEMKSQIYKIDENAICFIGDIREAFGEGFTKLEG